MMDTCTACGFNNVPGTLFCEGCGSPLSAIGVSGRFATSDVARKVPPPAAVDAFAEREQAPASALAEAADHVDDAQTVAESSLVGQIPQQAPSTSGELMPPKAPVAAQPPPRSPAPRSSFADVPAAAVGPTQSTPFDDVPASPQPYKEPDTVNVAYLVSEKGRRLDIPSQDVVIVGREDMRSGIRPDVDLTLDGASAAGVSRRHCRLLRQNDGWRVEDLMSTNYTVLNGKALAAHTPTPVRDGDELRLGKLRLRFHTA